MSKEKEIQEKTKTEVKGGKAALILRFLRKSKRYFAAAVVATAISSLAELINPQIIRVAIDQVIGHESTEMLAAPVVRLMEAFGGVENLRQKLWIMALAIVIVSLFGVLGKYLFRVCNAKGAETMVKTMRDTCYSHIARLPFAWHMKNHTGDIIQRCTSDIDTLKMFVSDQLTSLFRIVLLLVLSLSFMLSMDPLLTLVACIPMPLIILYSMRFHKKIGKGFLQCDENEGVLSAMAQENLTGVRVVRAFGRERYEEDRFQKQNEVYTDLWVKLGKTMSTFWSSADVLSGLQVMLVVVFGVVFCLRGQMTSGEYIAFISYNGMLVWPVRMLGRMISEMSKAGVSVDRIGQIMKAEEEQDTPGAKTPPMDREIRFEHVSFGYEGAPEMLHDISLTIPAGSTLGILGGTGSGKSTLMYLLDRLYPLPEGNGRITIGGVDIREIALGHLRGNIGLVLQEPFLFSRTLRENLMITGGSGGERPRGTDEMSEEAMREAAKTACLDETIDGFQKGYDTFVGERGVTLSGGQKQRAAIARMLTQKTPIMIFDDSLSAVDTETDAKIRKALEKQFGKATVILISHRITTLAKADQVLVMDHGRISQLGKPEELRNTPGLYQEIDRIQSMSAEEVAEG